MDGPMMSVTLRQWRDVNMAADVMSGVEREK